MKKKKILFVIPRFYGIGGLEKIIQQRLEFLSPHFDIMVFESDKDVDFEPTVFFDFGIKSINYKENTAIPILNYIRLYKQLVKTFSPDEVFVLDNGWKGLLIPYLSKNKSVSYERHGAIHFNTKKTIFHYFKIKIHHLLALKFNRIFFLNPSMAAKWLHTNKIVIPNGIKQAENSSPSKRKNVLWVGRESSEKGMDYLFTIWESIYVKFPDWKLFIFTPKPIKNDFFKTNGLNQNIENKVGITDMTSIYESGSILLNTSRYEGFGLTLLEAMNMKIPVISFDCEDGPTHLIENGKNGFLIPENDFLAYTTKLTTLMTNNDLRLKIGEAGKIKSLDFDLDRIHLKWVEIINS